MTTIYALRHKSTGAYMPARMSRAALGGWSRWLPELPDNPDGWTGCEGYDKNPRLFFTLRSAQNALTAWLMGVHRRDMGTAISFDGDDYYDGHVIDAPPVPRMRDDMQIVELTLAGLV